MSVSLQRGGASEGVTAGEGAAKSDYQLNIELMKAMGSPNGSDPIPPSQYLYFLDDPDPVQRVVAWMRSKTIRRGHRKPYAVDQDGNILTIQNLANDRFNGHWANAYKAWQAAEAQKLVAKDKQDGLCLCGNVPSREAQRKALENQANTETQPLCTKWSALCTEWSPPAYVREDVGRLEPDEQESFADDYRRFLSWADDVEADAMAAARAAIEEKEKPLYEKYGLRWRNGKKRRTEDRERPESVQLKLLYGPDDAHHVQNPADTSYMPKNGVVHDESRGPSLYSSEQRNALEQRTTTTEAPAVTEELAAPASAQPVVVVAQDQEAEVSKVRDALSRYDHVTPETCADLIAKCRGIRPGCSVDLIVSVISSFRIRSSTQNPIGLLRSQVPLKIRDWKEPKEASPPGGSQPRDGAAICPQCGETGFADGFEWGLLPEAEEHAATGAEFCSCQTGTNLRSAIRGKP